MATSDRNGNLGSAVADSLDGNPSWSLGDHTDLSLLFGAARPRYVPEEVTQPMELQRYAYILKGRKWVVILTTIVTLAVVALGSISMTPVYSASVLVRVTAGLSGSVTFTDLNYTERLIQTYVQLLKTRPFLEAVIRRLALQVPPEALVETIKAEALTDTELIKISVESTSPNLAAAIANTLGDLLVEQGQEMYYGQGKSAREILEEQVAVLEDQLRQDRALLASLSGSTPGPDPNPESSLQDLSAKIRAEEQTYAMLLSQYDKARVDEAMRANSIGIVEPATVPGTSSKPNLKLNVALGALVGLMGGLGLAFLFENLDPTIRSTADLETVAHVRLLGRIPTWRGRRRFRHKAGSLEDCAVQTQVGEAFRVLSTNLLTLTTEARLKTILIASAVPGAGKTMVITKLAAAMAQVGRRVIVVDGDLRNPNVHKAFDLAQSPGLSDVLPYPNHFSSVVKDTKVRGVRVLTSGSKRADPAVVMNELAMSEMFQKLAAEADIVLVDSPPILAAADAAMLASRVDGVLLVIEQPHARRETVRASCRQLADVNARLIGTVMNRTERNGSYYDRPTPSGEGQALS